MMERDDDTAECGCPIRLVTDGNARERQVVHLARCDGHAFRPWWTGDKCMTCGEEHSPEVEVELGDSLNYRVTR